MTRSSLETRPARERILETALELFYQRGVRNVGVDEIAARAGVTKVTLYAHFKSKDNLILEFLKLRDERWMQWFKSAVERRARDPRGRLLAIFDALEEWFRFLATACPECGVIDDPVAFGPTP